MKSLQQKCRNLIQTFIPALFVLVLWSAPAFCQSGPPPPPPFPGRALAFYPLETPPWADWFGLPARGFTNVNVAPSWDYDETALSVDTNLPAYVQEDVFLDGHTNMTFGTGSIFLWFQANWSSTTDGGTGPTNWAALFSVGNWTSNAAQSAWTIAISPSGTNLVMEAQSSGSNQVVFDVPIDFDAGDWHSIVVTYSLTNCCVYLEGQPVTNTGPIIYYPSGSECTNYGMFVGSLSTAGDCQCHGQLQWLATYDYPLSADAVASDYAEVSAYIAYWGGSLPSRGGFNPADDDGPPGGFGGSGTNSGGGYSGGVTNTFPQPDYVLNGALDYTSYTNFRLSISNSPSNVYVSVEGTLSNLTYLVLTNDDLSDTNGWAIWEVLPATNNVTPAPPLALGSNVLYFKGALVWSTGTNGLPDYWCMEYFSTLNVDPYADPDGDGLCNLDEYILGTNPTNANSITPLHTDAQALFLAYTNYDASCHYQLFVTNGPDTNTVLVTMSPTLVGTNYQIYTHDQSDTNNTWRVEANFLGTSSATTVAITLNGRSLDYIGGYGEDSDGDGLPDGYEVLATLTDPYLPDTGMTGIADGYKDPDGDGYSNLQEYYNGTNPHVFDTPLGPQGLVADYTDGINEITFTWEAASGPVLGYIVSYLSESTGNWTPIATNSPTQLTCLFTDLSDYGGEIGVQATYGEGLSMLDPAEAGQYPAVLAQAALAHGPGGTIYLLTSVLSTNVIGYNATILDFPGAYPESGFPFQDTEYYPAFSETNLYIPATQFTNGIAILSDAQAPPYALTEFSLLPELQGGVSGNQAETSPVFLNVPFIDGTAQMKQNIRFLLRAAGGEWPFASDYMSFGSDHVVSSLYYIYEQDPLDSQNGGPPNHFEPFEDNYYYLNFVFDTDFIDTSGNLDTGFLPFFYSIFDSQHLYYAQYTNAQFVFPTCDYVSQSNASVPIPAILSSNDTPWVGYFDANISPFGLFNLGGINQFGAFGTTNSLALSSASNIYGLPYNSLELTLTNGGIHFATLAPGSNVSGYNSGPIYLGTPQPELETVGYYFCKPGYDPIPSETGFAVTNTTPVIIGSVGTEMHIAGYAKQAVLNGKTNVCAYLGQYFTNAFGMSNGIVTTNPAGILSEYGEFFPTVPGQVALMTMPDPDQADTNGTCVVDIIRLSLDVNHDGIMDETYTGPDNTGPGAPFVFWVNNDYDRWTYSLLDGSVEDDVASDSAYATCPYTPTVTTPDCEYRDVNGNRAIPCPRDLEDYTRLWVSGASNTLSRLPSGSTVILWCQYNWDGYEYITNGNPTIDLFQAADPDGGIAYLTNLTTASNQINLNLCQYIGRLGAGQSIQLNSSQFSNNWAGDHFIWCGVSNGVGNLNLTIYDGIGNVLAWSTVYIQIQDIKQMYERWTVGDMETNALGITEPVTAASAAYLAQNDEPIPGQPPFQYLYDPATDTNLDYIVYVHGWNMPIWTKDRWAETAYKRLYWQGYQGRFGSFRWPANYYPNFKSYLNTTNYDGSEQVAWESGRPLGTFLAGLNSNYPNNVYVMAHSMGNVVVGEALRLAGANLIVNTYVASQAAVSARSYDNTVPADISIFLVTPDSEGHYYTNGAPPYFSGISGAGNFVDFYNPQDWALGKWVSDQANKPDPNYFWTMPSSGIPSGYYYGPSFSTIRSLRFTNDTYEIFSCCVQSYSLALGAETHIAAPFSASVVPVNLSASPFNFPDTHPGHSEQFRFDNMTTKAYWSQLLQSFKINTTPLK